MPTTLSEPPAASVPSLPPVEASPARKVSGGVRTAVGFGVAGFSLLMIYLGGIFLAGQAMAITLVGLREFYAMASRKGVNPWRAVDWLAGAAIVVAAAALDEAGLSQVVMCLLLATLLAFIFRGGSRASSFADAGVTVLGFLYIAWGFTHILELRKLSHPLPECPWGWSAGLFYTWILAWATAGSDVGSMVWGKLLGRHKLCPSISPNKTVEGSIGGVATAIVWTAAWCWLAHVVLWKGVVFGLVAAIAGQLGDLFESVLKRDAGVKDAGSIIPGHGGMLDRFDSYFFSTPAVYYLVQLVLLR